MEYVVGSVAALISGAGNTTPNRPRTVKRALTPVKHQPSPNVTPKSEFVDDRSIFMSPTLQKKKAIVKKSPKRIFQNSELDITNDAEGTSSSISPKAGKVKKHLKDDLEANTMANKSKSPKKGKNNISNSIDSVSAQNNKKLKTVDDEEKSSHNNSQVNNERTPKKKKKQRNSVSLPSETETIDEKENISIEISSKSPNKGKRKSFSECSEVTANETSTVSTEHGTPKKKKTKSSQGNNQSVSEVKPDEIPNTTDNNDKVSLKKNKKQKVPESQEIESQNEDQNQKIPTSVNSEYLPAKKKNKMRKKKSKNNQTIQNQETKSNEDKKSKVNPNAVTNKDTDSEHDSDDEINSDTEQTNKEILDTGPVSSDEEEKEEVKKPEKKVDKDLDDADVIKRTLFVGNVPFSNKCKKEIKKIFNKYGDIETVRIRGIPVKDARTTPKLAVIKSELHPERTSVNLYIKFKEPKSVDKALAENNTVLNGYHLRVSRSDSTGLTHDPKLSVFIGNLPFALEDEGLRAKFEKCGEIESIRIVRDKKTNVGKGFGYVNFKTKDGVELALALTEEDLTIKNRILRVKRCTMTQKNQGQKFQGQRNQGERNHGGQGQRNQGQRNQGQGQWNQGQRNEGQRNREQMQQGQNQQGQRNRGHMGQGQRNRAQMQQGQRHQGQMGQGQRNVNFKEQGAYRRVMNKRPREENDGGGPPNKKSKDFQPGKEKKPRKEFVGMTAEKKKKRKFDKGQKKKKVISEILSKKVN